MKYFIVTVLLAASLKFFLFPSVPAGLYWDEMDTGYQAYSLLHTGRDYFGNLFPAHLHSLADYRSGLYMYLTVPWVKLLGMSAFSVRITSVIFFLITLFLIYYLAKTRLRLGKYSWLPVMVYSFAPWLFIQSRIAAESTLVIPFLLLGLIGFPRRLWLSALGFSLCLWSYGTAKLFVPLFIILLFVINFKLISNLKFRISNLILPVLIFLLISAPVVYETLYKGIGMRFNELSVFSDPTVTTEVNWQRLEATLGSGQDRIPGMQSSFLEKLIYNKLTLFLTNVTKNYATSLSSDFLFLNGDPELRHNLNLSNTGQFYLIELLPFLLGLFYLFQTSNFKLKITLLSWLLLSPLPSIITRDGGTHGPRLLFMFPSVVFIIALGLRELFKRKSLIILYLLFYIPSVFLATHYFLTTYRSRSFESFNDGYISAINLALSQSALYDRVIIDTHNDSALMAYLFVSRLDPAVFQKSFPLPSDQPVNGVEGYKFGNVLLLYPGTHNWDALKLTGRNLIIASSTVPKQTSHAVLQTIFHPNSTPAFTAFASP